MAYLATYTQYECAADEKTMISKSSIHHWSHMHHSLCWYGYGDQPAGLSSFCSSVCSLCPANQRGERCGISVGACYQQGEHWGGCAVRHLYMYLVKHSIDIVTLSLCVRSPKVEGDKDGGLTHQARWTLRAGIGDALQCILLACHDHGLDAPAPLQGKCTLLAPQCVL